MHPQVLGEYHGAGPHVGAVLRVQRLQDTGRGCAGLPGAPAAAPLPAGPGTSGTRTASAAGPSWKRYRRARRRRASAMANRGRTRFGAGPRRPIGVPSPRDVTRSAAAGADGDGPLAQPRPPPGAAVKPGRCRPRRCPGGMGLAPPRAASRRREEAG